MKEGHRCEHKKTGSRGQQRVKKLPRSSHVTGNGCGGAWGERREGGVGGGGWEGLEGSKGAGGGAGSICVPPKGGNGGMATYRKAGYNLDRKPTILGL